MKKLFLLILTCVLYQSARSQGTDNLDYERLLQYYQSQQYNEALQYLQGIYKDSSDVKKLSQIAYSNLMAGKYAEAEKDYLRLNTQLPGNALILTGLANISTHLNQNDKAIALYTEVIKVDSSNFNAYKQLTRLIADPQNALKKDYLIKASLLNPLDAEIAAQMSDSYFKETQFTKAEATLKTALQADTNNLILLNARIPVSMALKNHDEALKTGKKLLAIYKTPPENLLFQMALCYRETKDYKTAITYFQNAIKEGISPKIASYYGLLGESYESMKQNKEAIDIYKRGLLFENNGSLYYNIALLYEDKLNDKKNAISYYTQYLNSIKDPEKQKRHIAFIKNKIEELKR